MSLGDLLAIPCAIVGAAGLVWAYVTKDWPWKWISQDETAIRSQLAQQRQQLDQATRPVRSIDPLGRRTGTVVYMRRPR